VVLYLTISRFQWRSQKQNSASWYNFSVCLELALKKTLPKDEPNNNIQRSIWSKNYIDLTIFRVSISSDGCTGRSLMWIFMWFRLTRLGLTSSSLNPSKNWSWCLGISLSQVKWKTRGIRRKNRDSPWFLEPCCVWCCSMVLFCGMYWKIFPGTLLVYDGSYKAAEFIFSGDFCHSLFHWKTYWVFKTAHYWMHLKWWIFASFLRFLLWIVWKDIWVDSYERHRICLRFSPYIKVVFSLMNDMIKYFVILIWSIFSLLSLYLFLHIFGLKDFWVYFGCWSDFLLI